MIKVIAFDFDGVLADSVAVKDAAFYKLFEPYGKEKGLRAMDFHKQTPGLYRLDKIRRCFKEVLNVPLSNEELAEKVRLFSEMVVEQVVAAPWISGAREFFESKPLQPCYVISAAPRDEVQTIVIKRHMKHFIKDVYGGPDKKKDILETILEIEGCAPAEMLFIGDSISDFNAADEKGVLFLGIVPRGVTNLFPDKIEILSDLTGLNKLLTSLNRSSISYCPQ